MGEVRGNGPEAMEQAQVWVDEARAVIERWNRTAVTFIRERPGASLLGALALGFVVGRLVARR